MDAANGLDVAIEDTAKELGAAMRATLAASAIRAGILRLTVGGEAVYINAEPVVAMGRAGVTPPPGAFLQASSKGEQAMVEILTAAIGKAKRVVDLFCGLGAFTFPLAGTSAVLAVDGDRRAIDALVKAANHTQGLKRIETKVRDLLREPLSPKELETFDAAVFDPPRAGASSQAERLAKSKLKTVVAVSCNPATLARDARILIDGGYRLESITPIDQFLFSPHIEAVAVFRR